MTPYYAGLRRRDLLGAAGSAMGMSALPGTARALPPMALRFPRDAGSHNDFATEWWYITGYASAPSTGTSAPIPPAFGFQVTFFRKRIAATQDLPSRLAARQLLLAHAAVTDVQGKKLWHDQRIARWSGEPPGTNPADLAAASLQDTDIVLRDWSLRRVDGNLRAHISASEFALHLTFKATQAVL
ncbi:MAG: carotenoid 1,2-hydratase, partial [Burkholderiales bacterium PBB4]